MEEESRDHADGDRARHGDAAALRRRRALIAAAAFALASAGAARAQTVTGFATARYGSGITTQDEIEIALAATAAQSVAPIAVASPAPTDLVNPGTSAEGEATLAMDLGAGFFSMATGSAGEVLGFGVTRFGVGSTRVDYRENVTIESASVPDGTPVTIRLRYRIAFGRACFHDLTAEQLATTSVHACLTDLEVRAVLNDLLGEVDVATHTHFVPVGFASTITGLFAAPAQSDERAITAAVGDTIRVELFADAGGIHRLGGPYQETFPSAASGTSLVLVFGIESDVPGVTIQSPLLGGPLPGFSGVTAENALARALGVSVGAPVTVPEPRAPALAAAACAALLARRRYAASQASA